MTDVITSSIKDKTLKGIIVVTGLAVLGLTFWNLVQRVQINRRTLSEGS